MMLNSIQSAMGYAVCAHSGQTRKYVKEPYHNHPFRVSALAKEGEESINLQIALLLHDVVEDTSRTLEDVTAAFGSEVGALVNDLTTPSFPEGKKPPRAVRVKMEITRLARISDEAKRGKMYDITDNIGGLDLEVMTKIGKLDWARMYISEKIVMLPTLRSGSEFLYQKTMELLKNKRSEFSA